MIANEGRSVGVEAHRRLVQSSGAQCRIEPGLTADEFARIEAEFQIAFADDHRAFLTAGLPVSVPAPEQAGVIRTWATPWPDWRSGDREALREQLAFPADGVLFDVENNGFWPKSWGPRPTEPSQATTTARAALATVPALIPVYGHRFLPSGRGSSGHPVLSVWQTDIIYYGVDLVDWISQEFGGPGLNRSDPAWNPQATVPFWKDLVG